MSNVVANNDQTDSYFRVILAFVVRVKHEACNYCGDLFKSRTVGDVRGMN